MCIKSNISNKLLQEIILAYQGEVYGEALFTSLAKLSTKPSEQTKWQLLMRLEQTIQQNLQLWLASISNPIKSEPQFWQQGVDEAEKIGQKTWSEAMLWLKDLSEPYVKKYAQMAQHQVGDPKLQHVLQDLAKHEEALFLFASGELAGDSRNAVKLLKSLFSA